MIWNICVTYATNECEMFLCDVCLYICAQMYGHAPTMYTYTYVRIHTYVYISTLQRDTVKTYVSIYMCVHTYVILLYVRYICTHMSFSLGPL